MLITINRLIFSIFIDKGIKTDNIYTAPGHAIKLCRLHKRPGNGSHRLSLLHAIRPLSIFKNGCASGGGIFFTGHGVIYNTSLIQYLTTIRHAPRETQLVSVGKLLGCHTRTRRHDSVEVGC